MKCANCGTESKGNFCPSCGASMRAANCAGCGSKLVPGARFCTSCGTEAGTSGGGSSRRGGSGSQTADSGSSNLPWYIAGAVLLVLLFVLITPMIMGEDNRVPDRGTATFNGQAGPGGLAPLTGTPREQADRLFNRVMAAREQGNMPEALQFAPMGVQAYQMAEPLDDDGLYHLATLQNTASDFNGALQTAERILSRNPDHLLGLASAAEAAEGAGDTAAARQYHQRLLDAYETEIGRNLPEYMDHARILPEYRQAAQRAVAQGG
ncbi:MAG TPA: zinc ribbon domain-containing protein [Longimicrobiales bacterium]|nr:zinc ribbon domain-containing protein [Longimicrobiales bacterium]